MDNKLIMLVITLAIGVIVVGSVLMPVLQDTTATEDTEVNKGLFEAVPLTADSNHTLVFNSSTPNTIKVDDVDIDMSNLNSTYGSATVIFSNDWFMRFVPDTGLILYKCGTSNSQAIKGATASSGISVTVTITNGDVTFVYSDETTVEYEVADDGFMITPGKGTYVMKTSGDTAYVNGDSVVYGVGRTDRALGTAATSFNAIVKATVDDGVTPLYYSPQYNWGDVSTVTYTEDSTHEDLYSLTGFTFNLVTDPDTTPVNHPITYNQILVPKEVTAERTQHLDDNENSLLLVIPVLFITGLVVLGVRSFMGNRD